MSAERTRKAETAARPAPDSGGAGTRPGAYRPPLSVTRPEMLREGSDSAFRELIWGLLVVAKRLQKYPEIFGRRIGISSAQYMVLIATAHIQGREGIGIRTLADYMHLPAPHVTTTVGRLVDGGLLAKRQDPADGRCVLISMTRSGDLALRELAPFQQQINDVLFAGLSRQEFEAFATMIKTLLVNSERAFDKVAEIERKHEAPREAAD
ncbi:MAG: MarR family winged helix-turn-helix transcriptional regulator [Alphaproteobacteria bacterium]